MVRKNDKTATIKSRQLAIKPGSKIVLIGGKGSKRQFNKKNAEVVCIPVRNSWMTIKLAGVDTLIKWRKGGVRQIQTIEKKEPESNSGIIEMLNDETLQHILSFVIGDRETERTDDGQQFASTPWMIFKVGKLHALLRTLCREWKSWVDDILPRWLGLVDFNLNCFGYHLIPLAKDWLARHGIRLGALNFTRQLYDIPMVIGILQDCDTQQLCEMRAYCNLERLEYAVPAPLLDDGGVLDVDRAYAEAITAHATEAKTEKILHDAIAQNCPKLATLSVTVTLPAASIGYSEYISSSLFSMPSISKLKISLGYHRRKQRGPTHLREKVITQLVRHLSSLRHLQVTSPSLGGFVSRHGRTYEIESETLNSISTIGLGKQLWVSVKCPGLRRFTCNGTYHGNGTQPVFSNEEITALSQQFGYKHDFEKILEEDTYVVPFGELKFDRPSFEVPDACAMVFERFQPGAFAADLRLE